MATKLPWLKDFPKTTLLFSSTVFVIFALYFLNRSTAVKINFSTEQIRGATTSAVVTNNPPITGSGTARQTTTVVISKPTTPGTTTTTKTTTTTTTTVISPTPFVTSPKAEDTSPDASDVSTEVPESSADSSSTDNNDYINDQGTVEISRDQENLVLKTNSLPNRNANEMKVTINKRGLESKVTLRPHGEGIAMEGNQSSVTTSLPLFLDQFKGQFLSADTRGQKRPIALLPDQVKSKILKNKIEDGVTHIELKENLDTKSTDDEVFLVQGYKQIKFWEVFNFKQEITARVGARTGKILALEEPIWLRIISPLLK